MAQSCQNPGPARPPHTQVPCQATVILGLINYLQPFIPGLVNKTMFLWEQTAEWDWSPLTDSAFQHLKAWICQTLLTTTFAYYDWSKSVIVWTDTSEYGLSAALIQCSRPITFASKTLTDVKTHYANIERECLSVCFDLEIFHTYLYGRHLIIENAHMPLEMIQYKTTHAASMHAEVPLHNTE